MKTHIALLFLIILSLDNMAQCIVESKEDYTISASFSPAKLLPQDGCIKGPGSFKVEIDYTIKVEGKNIPKEPVYYYQISLTCGSNKLSPSGNLPITNSEISGAYTTGQNYFRESDCTSSTLESLNCYGEKNINFIGSGPNNLNFNISCEAIKPADNTTFKNLNGSFNSGSYKITWEENTSNEIEYFLVEKSKDEKNFERISDKIITEKGKKYEFIDADKNIFSDIYYYRILAVKANGSIKYSLSFSGGGL